MNASAGPSAEPAPAGAGAGAGAGRGALVFVGFMGAGKSSAARIAAAAASGRDPLDSDRLLEQRFGHPIEVEFERAGEAAFRAAEEELVCSLLARAGPGEAISLGGGAVGSERVRQALGSHTTVLLEVTVELAWERAGHKRRPLARDRSEFERLYESRRGLYEDVADAIVPGGDREVIARALPELRRLADARRAEGHGARLVWATSASGDYPVYLGPGLLGPGAPWPELPAGGASRRFLVTDEHVGPLYGDRVGPLAAPAVTLPAGEQHKSLEGAGRVWRELAGAGMTGHDHLVALGGGVVGDLAGFCAATYQRGVAVVHVPTSLVAQVDSAYGGKTGIDLPEAKNYVGAYHQPAGVIVDPDLLGTLPAPELAAGYVEVLKTALIAGGPLWERVAEGQQPDEQMILGCARTKLQIVAADERDAGPRQTLNLGHTVGHAIETATGYARYRHGEAVGLGLLAALRLSGQDELCDQVRALLDARGLPVALRGADPEDVLAAVARDKKRTPEGVPFVLVERPGAVCPGTLVSERDLRAAVDELAAGG